MPGKVHLRFFAPSEILKHSISTYYLMDISAEGSAVSDYLHPEWANLRIVRGEPISAAIGGGALQELPRFLAVGPTSQATNFSARTSRIWGIGMLPEGWARLVGMPAENYTNDVSDASADRAFSALLPLRDALISADGDDENEAGIIDRFLVRLQESNAAPADPAIARAHAALADPAIASVGDLADRIGITERSLERLSRKVFGFPPKLLLRRQRFLRSLAQFMLDPSLKWISTLDYHYHDQAHFARDFKSFMGMTPRQYAALDKPIMLAAAAARMAHAGAAMQALHKMDE